MDISKTYIEMHVALPKHMRKSPSEGDYYYNPVGGSRGQLGEVYFDTSKMIRLYTQDQLQEMIGIEDAEDFFNYMGQFSFAWGDQSGMSYPEWAESLNGRGVSMEQLWLAFVMKEKYNKIWDGESWKVIDRGDNAG